MIICGFDPGTATTGYGVIKQAGKSARKFSVIDYGRILTKPGVPAGKRLEQIYNQVDQLIKKYRPDLVAIENIFFFKNLKTAMPVSQAKGVILLAASKNKVPVQEITPLQVKMTVVGYGRADKKQVQKMVETLLDLKKPIKSDDAADALGVAICGALKNRNIG